MKHPYSNEKRFQVCLKKAETILPAAKVISMLTDYVDANEYVVSKKGLREGLMLKALHKKQMIPSHLTWKS